MTLKSLIVTLTHQAFCPFPFTQPYHSERHAPPPSFPRMRAPTLHSPNHHSLRTPIALLR